MSTKLCDPRFLMPSRTLDPSNLTLHEIGLISWGNCCLLRSLVCILNSILSNLGCRFVPNAPSINCCLFCSSAQFSLVISWLCKTSSFLSFSLFLFLLRGFPSTWFDLYLLKTPWLLLFSTSSLSEGTSLPDNFTSSRVWLCSRVDRVWKIYCLWAALMVDMKTYSELG